MYDPSVKRMLRSACEILDVQSTFALGAHNLVESEDTFNYVNDNSRRIPYHRSPDVCIYSPHSRNTLQRLHNNDSNSTRVDVKAKPDVDANVLCRLRPIRQRPQFDHSVNFERRHFVGAVIVAAVGRDVAP